MFIVWIQDVHQKIGRLQLFWWIQMAISSPCQTRNWPSSTIPHCKIHRMALIAPFQQQQDNDVRMWFFLECIPNVTLIAHDTHPIETKWRIICTLARCTKKIKNTDKSQVVSFAPLACTETVAALMIWPRHQQHNIKLFIASRSEK